MEKKFLAKSYGFYSHFYFELKKTSMILFEQDVNNSLKKRMIYKI